MESSVIVLLQVGFMLLLSPFINTLMKKMKAILQGRQGPPLMQGYYDLLKYFRKETVVSEQASWIFSITPLVVFSSTLVAALIIPTFFHVAAINFLGGIILLLYLLGLGRFFMVSAAMEPGGGFCGMASSREMMLSTLIEPVMLLSLFVFATMAQSSNLTSIMNWLSGQGLALITPGYIVAFLALMIVCIAEMGRVPFDNPETHYELTMIHEGMLLEYSGKPLGLMFWSSWMKQLLLLSLLASFIPPWKIVDFTSLQSILMAILLYLLKLLFLCLFVVLIETTIAKVRLFRVKDLLGASFVLAIIALILSVHQATAGGIKP